MIAVIADDLSGAAEIAGIAAQYGYRTEVHTVFDPHTDAEVVAIDTDTRSLPAAEGARIVAGVAAVVLTAKPSWIFKKTDSVLRGNVRAEIESILAVTGQKRALLVPANPSKGRIIRDGTYFINEVPLAQSAFARDPEHPRTTSVVAEMLELDEPRESLLVPHVVCVQDVNARAAEVDANTLPAGGADFFEAILKAKGKMKVFGKVEPVPSSGATLFVCGSPAAWDSGRTGECTQYRIPILPMPEEIFNGHIPEVAMNDWCVQTTTALRDHGRAMLTIGRQSNRRSVLAGKQLIDRLVDAVASVLATEKVGRLCLEGGATAAAVLARFGWKRMIVLPIELPGGAALCVSCGPCMLIKPGSYPWPQTVLDLHEVT